MIGIGGFQYAYGSPVAHGFTFMSSLNVLLGGFASLKITKEHQGIMLDNTLYTPKESCLIAHKNPVIVPTKKSNFFLDHLDLQDGKIGDLYIALNKLFINVGMGYRWQYKKIAMDIHGKIWRGIQGEVSINFITSWKNFFWESGLGLGFFNNCYCPKRHSQTQSFNNLSNNNVYQVIQLKTLVFNYYPYFMITNGGVLNILPENTWLKKYQIKLFFNVMYHPVIGFAMALGVGLVPRYILKQKLKTLILQNNAPATMNSLRNK